MQLRVEPGLVEEVVFLQARHLEETGDSRAFAAIRRRVDDLYEVGPPGEERDRAFRREHSALFRELGHDGLITTTVEEFPLIARSIETLVVRRAIRARDEGSEMFVPGRRDAGPAGRPRAMIAVRPERFLSAADLIRLLRRELFHVLDMLDPAFGYEPDLGTADATPAERDRVQSRYRALWSSYVAARLDDPATPRLTHRDLVARATERS